MAKTLAVVAGVVGGLALAGVALRGAQLDTAAPQASRPSVYVMADERFGAQASSASSSAAASHRAVLDRYCVTCHNQRQRTAGLTLDTADVEQVRTDAAVWEKVVRKLRTGLMPPVGRPRPTPAAYASLTSYLETALDRAAAREPNPGRLGVQRLNRAEYTNAVRDLLALPIDGRELLPADESGYGFDNIGDVLSVSPGLLERYVLAAAKISRSAVGDPTLRPSTALYKTSPLMLQDGRMSEDLPFGSRGGLAVRHHFPLDGDYVIRVSLDRNLDGAPIRRGVHHLDVRLDRAHVKRFTLGEQEEGQAYNRREYKQPLEVRLSVKAGTHLVGVAFQGAVDQFLPRDERPAPPPPTAFAFQLYAIDPAVNNVQIIGPFNGQVPEETASRRRIFVCSPTTSAAEQVCAERIVATLARRAYRRPATDADVDELLVAYRNGRSQGSFEDGIRWVVEAVLVSPKFLFRIEHDPADVAPGTAYRLSDVELASRLSFFLWSSIPDDELLHVAISGQLRDQAVLAGQVRRMVKDPRAHALVENFAGQWLYLRNLRTVAPNASLFPDFDDNLREALRRETELFFEYQLHEDRSVLELLTADHTFLNDRLAAHYGIPNVYGSHFRRVTYPDNRRAGLLGHGSILTVTSYPNRTSPVVRGKWLLENLLGAPPPPPPANVPALRENDEGGVPATVRERLEQHRANPVCASCHARMDPLGFALENFDAVGQWRSVDHAAGASIDASGTLPDGRPFATPAEFRAALLSEPWRSEFVATVTERLLTYALGRGLEHYDQPVVRQIIREAAASDTRWSSIILGIVESSPFQMRLTHGSGSASAQ